MLISLARLAAILVFVGALGLLPATRGDDPSRGKGPERPRVSLETLREMQDLSRQLKKKGVLESPFDDPTAPKKGMPESVLKYLAQRAGARIMRTVAPEQVLESAVEELARDRLIGAEDVPPSPEAPVILDVLQRPALLTCDARIAESIPPKWFTKLTGGQAPQRVRTALRSVGLITYRNVDNVDVPVGTGWVLAPGVVVTNAHVAVRFAPSGKIKANPVTNEPIEVTINFAREWCLGDEQPFRVTRAIHVVLDENPDVALLEVEPKNKAGLPLPPPLKVATTKPKAPLKEMEVFVAGYPFDDPTLPSQVRKEIFAGIYGVKRCAPGQFQPDSGQGATDMLYHDCSTLGGNSGSPVVVLAEDATPLVVGLHFAGTFKEKNWAWPMWKVAEVPEVKKIIPAP